MAVGQPRIWQLLFRVARLEIRRAVTYCSYCTWSLTLIASRALVRKTTEISSMARDPSAIRRIVSRGTPGFLPASWSRHSVFATQWFRSLFFVLLMRCDQNGTPGHRSEPSRPPGGYMYVRDICFRTVDTVANAQASSIHVPNDKIHLDPRLWARRQKAIKSQVTRDNVINGGFYIRSIVHVRYDF